MELTVMGGVRLLRPHVHDDSLDPHPESEEATTQLRPDHSSLLSSGVDDSCTSFHPALEPNLLTTLWHPSS